MRLSLQITRALSAPTSENALLESPTGSGKSLSLLCSVLSWLHHQKSRKGAKCASLSTEELPQEILFKKELPPSVSKIYICSRTHRQITQLVKELGSTSYRPKMAVLGSRNHLCLQNAALNSADPNEKWYLKFLFTSSKEMVKDGACKYYHRADNLAKAMKDTIWDIEDLVENGRDVKGIFWLLKWQGVHIMLPGLLLKRQKLCLHLTITFVTRKSGQQWQSTSRTMSSLLMRPTTLKTPPEKRVAMRLLMIGWRVGIFIYFSDRK